MKQLSFWKGKKVMITGHTGFKGSWLTKILLMAKAEVIGYALTPTTTPDLFSILKLEKQIQNYFGDIRDLAKLKQTIEIEKPEIIFHLAAQPIVRDSYDGPLTTYTTNVMGTVNILQAIAETNCVKAAVIITTDKVYENLEKKKPFKEKDKLGGHDPYSCSKACVELIVDSYRKSFFSTGPAIASARAGNVIGGGDWSKDRIVPDIIRAFLESSSELVLRSPKAIRPWQHVLDPLNGYLILAEKLYEGDCKEAFNFAPDKKGFVAVEQLVKEGIRILGQGSYRVETSNKHESMILKLDSSKARKRLQWRPRLDMDNTLEWTFSWYKSFYGENSGQKIIEDQIKEYFEAESIKKRS